MVFPRRPLFEEEDMVGVVGIGVDLDEFAALECARVLEATLQNFDESLALACVALEIRDYGMRHPGGSSRRYSASWVRTREWSTADRAAHDERIGWWGG